MMKEDDDNLFGDNGHGSAEKEIEAYEKEVNEGLRRVYRKSHFEAADYLTPLDVILSVQPDPLDRLTLEQLLEKLARSGINLETTINKADAISILHALRQVEEDTKLETVRNLFNFFCQEGLEPFHVMRLVYTVASHMGLEPWVRLSLREKALILDDSHGSQHFRISKIVNFLRRRGALSYKAPGQKSRESKAKYSKCQKGNDNRKRKFRPRHIRFSEKQKRIKK